MNAMRQVFWGQGGFLSPQHLQRQDAWLQQYSLRLHAQVTPFYWGFETLQLREDALDNGVVDIDRFTLITRDGERISGGSSDTYARENGRVPARSLVELPVTSKEPIALYLASQRERTLDIHARGDSGRLPPRHQLVSEDIEDPFDPEAPAASIDFLAHQLRIVTSLDDNVDNLLQGCEAYKFAEIVATAPGQYKPALDYIPPAVAIAASNNLLRWTRALRDLMVSRGQDFAAAKRQRGIRAASTSAQEVMRLVMMQSFARYICALQEHVRLGVVSPYPLYQQLRQLVAEFSTFSEDTDYFGAVRGRPETELPDYDHDDLRLCFRRAFERAEALVKALTVGAEVGITLAFDGRYYKADLPAHLFDSDKTRFYLAFESGIGGQALFERLSHTGKIASIEEMPKLLQAALFGLKIDLLPVPPEELPQKTPNTTYFLVDTRHPFWAMIRNNRNIAVFSDLPPDDTVIKLYPVGAEE